MYLEEPAGQDDFQPTRGRWDSKAISMQPDDRWPLAWPKNDDGNFDDARYCCFFTLATLRSK
jgi:hypothetical protein